MLLSPVLAYTGSYYRISRRGMAEGQEYDLDGFLYVPAKEAFASKDLRRHYQRRRFYAPANWVDRKLFGGPAPVLSIVFDLK
jgi:hypothetical protein